MYVVNRRTVVDQATEEAKTTPRAIDPESRSPALSELSGTLTGLASIPSSGPLAISTLRGQFADNREWSADPSRPAVIVGHGGHDRQPPLFSGYGIGFKSKPLHAGFLGQDVLLVHDEAHLEPAFQELLVAIKEEQDRCREFPRFRVMELSATSRGKRVVRPEREGSHRPRVKKRIEAKKSLQPPPERGREKTGRPSRGAGSSHEESKRAVLVFVRTVEDVEKVAEKLRKNRRSKR